MLSKHSLSGSTLEAPELAFCNRNVSTARTKTFNLQVWNPGDFGGNVHRVQGNIRCKILAAIPTVK